VNDLPSKKTQYRFAFLLVCFVIAFANVCPLFAQNNQRCQWLKFSPKIHLKDSLSIHSTSVFISNIKTLQNSDNEEEIIKKLSFQFEKDTLKFALKDNPIHSIISLIDSILVCYRVFPIHFTEKKFLRIEKFDSMRVSLPQYSLSGKNQNAFLQKEELFSSSQLQKTGSLTRGVSFGNAQDVFVNSALNLQLDGKLSDDLELTATITDQNVPYQPEGNTQQIQDFDRVFLQLKHSAAILSAGDILLKNDSTYFLKFWKNVQGAEAEVRWHDFDKNDSSNNQAISKLGISVAKGQFQSQWITPIEGVSGAYRLTGANNERFLVVIANSEKVFLDGKLLQRGFNQDYVIDYNNAEITFTNRVVITKFSRIRVDFEYALQAYSRTIVQASHRQIFKKNRLSANCYREADNENNSLFFTLSEEDKNILSIAGDDNLLAISQNVDTLKAFMTERIVYFSKDTLVDAQTYPIFVLANSSSNPSNREFYVVNFTEVGTNKGDYIIENFTAQGRTFRWVAPQNGISQGNFAPIKRLTPPNYRQMISLSGDFQVGAKSKVFGEIAFSDHDKNLFSAINDNDNQGIAFKTGYQIFQKTLYKNIYLDAGVDWEHNSLNFKPIDRFREVEFDRNWSISLDTVKNAPENIVKGFFNIQKKSENQTIKNNLSYQFTRRIRENQLEGWQHELKSEHYWKKWEFLFSSFWMKTSLFSAISTKKSQEANWQKINAQIRRKGKWWQQGYVYATDQHQVIEEVTKNVIATAMYASTHRFFIESSVRQSDSIENKKQRTPLNFYADVAYRENFVPILGELKLNNRTQEANLRIQQNKGNRYLSSLMTYRLLQNVNLPSQPFEETLMLRTDWNETFLNQAIRSELVYNISSGRELKREFIFVKVENGIGTHTWRDDDGDGVQDLGEFYPAINPDERDYVKYFVPTDAYIPAFSNQLNYRLNVQSPKNWHQKKGWKKIISRFQLTSAFVWDRKIKEATLWERVFPFGKEFSANEANEEKLLAIRTQNRHILFFNRQNTSFGADFQWNQTGNKQLLSNGFEQRRLVEQSLNIRWTIAQTLNIRVQSSQKQSFSKADFANDRNYELTMRDIFPEITYQPSQKWRIALRVGVKKKDGLLQNTDNEKQEANFREARLEGRWAKMAERSVQLEIRYASIKYVGRANTPLGYEMLEALNVGDNFTWNVQLTQKVLKGLQLNVSYNGRKSDNQRITHIGRMQLTALF
jgi:hypothetical protein